MKFLDSLYSVTQSRKTEGGFEFDISFFPGHFIYKAHFPGEPITPGVCIIQIATELFSLKFACVLSAENEIYAKLSLICRKK